MRRRTLVNIPAARKQRSALCRLGSVARSFRLDASAIRRHSGPDRQFFAGRSPRFHRRRARPGQSCSVPRRCQGARASRPPIHSPFFLDAAILSRMRSPVTSRSNWANESNTLRVSRPMLVVVLKAWVIETNETPCASNTSTILAKSESERVQAVDLVDDDGVDPMRVFRCRREDA